MIICIILTLSSKIYLKKNNLLPNNHGTFVEANRSLIPGKNNLQ